jgi:hypothetical protein
MNDSSAQSSPNGLRAGSPRAKKSIAATLAVAALAAAGCQTRDARDEHGEHAPAAVAAAPAGSAAAARVGSAAPAAPGSAAPAAPAGSAGSANRDPQYAADIDALCNSIERADAVGHTAQEQQVMVAMWLGDNIHTAAARAFLVQMQPLVGDAKADALDAERARVGLATCPLAAVWRASASPGGSAERLSAP